MRIDTPAPESRSRLRAERGRRTVRVGLALAAAAVPLTALAPLANAAVESPASRIQIVAQPIPVQRPIIGSPSCNWFRGSPRFLNLDPCPLPPRCGGGYPTLPQLWCPPVDWPQVGGPLGGQPETSGAEL